MQNEIPEFSYGEQGGQVLWRVDSGKFLDSVYSYSNLQYNPTSKALEYEVSYSTLVVNGVTRAIDYWTTEEHEEFCSKVATPIATYLQEMTKASMNE